MFLRKDCTIGQMENQVPDEIKKATAKRRGCEALADSFQRQGLEGKAGRVRNCGTQLTFAYVLEEERLELHQANYCRERLCPMCAWLRTKKVFAQVSQVMDAAEQERPELVPVFLTLTVRNCTAAELGAVLDSISQGWNRLNANKRMKRLIVGWFRALEITYNEREDTYHPHLHAVLLMPPSYFTEPKDYMTTEQWVKLWRKAMRLDYDPVCDIRRVEPGEDKAGAVAEVAKYTVKDSDYIKPNPALTDKLVSVFSAAVKGRRLVAFGGLMKEIAKRLKLNLEDMEPGEITGADGRVLRKDIDYILLLYRWNIGLTRYDYEREV